VRLFRVALDFGLRTCVWDPDSRAWNYPGLPWSFAGETYAFLGSHPINGTNPPDFAPDPAITYTTGTTPSSFIIIRFTDSLWGPWDEVRTQKSFPGDTDNLLPFGVQPLTKRGHIIDLLGNRNPSTVSASVSSLLELLEL
jgi:hypothetical protein